MEFEISGHIYKVSKIDAKTQFHIVRRLAPIFSKLKSLFSKENSDKGTDVFNELANVIAGMSDDDAEYCIFSLLKAVQRKQEGGLGYGKVSIDNNLMYQDINMQIMLQLAWKALSYNMSDFFVEMPQALQEQLSKQNGQ